MYPFIKDNDRNGEYVYSFEDPKYKSIIESGLLSMKKALDYILQASSIVTDSSEPKFCSSYEKIIKAFPFMNNKQSNEFIIKANDNYYITLKTSINLSRRKNTHNLIKLFCSFWILQQIYRKLLITIMGTMETEPYIIIGVYRNNPYKKSNLCRLILSSVDLTTTGLELINLLNSKYETDE